MRKRKVLSPWLFIAAMEVMIGRVKRNLKGKAKMMIFMDDIKLGEKDRGGAGAG